MNKEPNPKTVSEAIIALDKMLHDEDKTYMRDNGYIMLHSSLGRHIRNEWGLWGGSELADHIIENYGESHPDDMSGIILNAYCKHLNK